MRLEDSGSKASKLQCSLSCNAVGCLSKRMDFGAIECLRHDHRSSGGGKERLLSRKSGSFCGCKLQGLPDERQRPIRSLRLRGLLFVTASYFQLTRTGRCVSQRTRKGCYSSWMVYTSAFTRAILFTA